MIYLTCDYNIVNGEAERKLFYKVPSSRWSLKGTEADCTSSSVQICRPVHTRSFQGSFLIMSNSTNVIMQSHGSSKQSQLFAACFYNPGNVQQCVKESLQQRELKTVKWSWQLCFKDPVACPDFCILQLKIMFMSIMVLLFSPVLCCLFINQ